MRVPKPALRAGQRDTPHFNLQCKCGWHPGESRFLLLRIDAGDGELVTEVWIRRLGIWEPRVELAAELRGGDARGDG